MSLLVSPNNTLKGIKLYTWLGMSKKYKSIIIFLYWFEPNISL